MSKKFKTNKDRLKDLEKRSELIKESFQKEFNKIVRIDERFYHEETDGQEKNLLSTRAVIGGKHPKPQKGRLVTRRVEEFPLKDTPYWFIGGVYYKYEDYKEI